MSNVCFCCGQKFHPIRSDQLFCSKHCRYKYYHHNDMILTLKKKWFDMILLKIKTEEYREIKPYWEKGFPIILDDIMILLKTFLCKYGMKIKSVLFFVMVMEMINQNLLLNVR